MNTAVQAFFDSVKGKTVAFIGIGTSNLPLIRQFAEKGAKVIACDRKDFEALGENGVKAKEYGAELLLGDDYLKNIKADIVFRSPGTPFYKEELVSLRQNGVVLTSEMEVFFALCPCKTIAVTGSDGKTTTTAPTARPPPPRLSPRFSRLPARTFTSAATSASRSCPRLRA